MKSSRISQHLAKRHMQIYMEMQEKKKKLC